VIVDLADPRARAILPIAVVTGASLLSVVAFWIRGLVRGRTIDAAEKRSHSVVLSGFLVEWAYWFFSPVVRAAVALGIHPDVFSWSSLVLHLVGAVLLARGEFGLGGWMLVLGSFCDAIDGVVARARGVASDAGEVLDAAVDRWAEMAVFFGLAWYYRSLWWAFFLAVAACAGSIMVSYARAKGEAFGIDAKGGLMQRHERAAWLCSSTVLSGIWEAFRPSPGFAHHGMVLVALAAIAVLANWTGWLRTSYTRAELRKR
jgi:CDP-diacylglycerol--glycerol-3-phosphate 3-phosphatidyltransferase